ncbi:MAG: tyrosine-type recombinase/integrase [Acidimicrobiales bacterium]
MREHRFQTPPGPLGPYADGYRRHLEARGYTFWSVQQRLTYFAGVSSWLASEGLRACDLDESTAVCFADWRTARGRSTLTSPLTMRLPLTYLRGAGVVPERPDDAGRFGDLLASYRSYLVHERGLAEKTVVAHLVGARRFLDSVLGDRRELTGLRACDVTCYVVQTCRDATASTARSAVLSTSSLLRFLQVEGMVTSAVASAVPKLARQRPAPRPPALSQGEISRLLASCDRRRAAGRRDYAVILLCSRLGLRPCEVAALTLDDIDWHHGEILVRGKGDRHERMPLPPDVGAAIAAYLHRGRPRRQEFREVFLRARAPWTRLDFVGVQSVVQNASRRAGFVPFGPRRLRQHAASEMHRTGTALVGIAEVLRHHHFSMTTVYVDVPQPTVAALARYWPGGAR